MRRGLVVGGGGTLGLAWAAGALSRVEEALGWDAREATVILGSGSGSELAAILGAGYRTSDVVDALTGHPAAPSLLGHHLLSDRRRLPSVPVPAPSSLGLALAGLRRRVPAQSALAGLLPVGTGSFDRVVALGRDLSRLSTGDPGGWVPHPATWLVAAERRTGRRVPFGFRGGLVTDLGVALAAATARPGWYAPVRIHDRAYVDATVSSPTSADLLLPLGLDEVIVLAPSAGRDGGLGFGLSVVDRVARRTTTMRVDLEEAVLTSAGTRVIRVEPGPADLDAMGVNPMDHRRRREVVLTSLSTSRERVADAVRRTRVGQLTSVAPPGNVPSNVPSNVWQSEAGPVSARGPEPPPAGWRRLLRLFGAARPAA